MKPYLTDGSSSAAILWDVEKLGYLTAWAGKQLADGKPMDPDATLKQRIPTATYVPDQKMLLLGAGAADHQGQRRPVQLLSRRRWPGSPRCPAPALRHGGHDDHARTNRGAPHAPPAAPPVLTLTGVQKRYGGVRALGGVDFELQAGEVHAIVGENGAGKSTLIKIISGAETADEGIDRRSAAASSPPAARRRALQAGIATVYQEPHLFGELTVAENVFIGREIRRRGIVDRARPAGARGRAARAHRAGARARRRAGRRPRRWPSSSS